MGGCVTRRLGGRAIRNRAEVARTQFRRLGSECQRWAGCHGVAEPAQRNPASSGRGPAALGLPRWPGGRAAASGEADEDAEGHRSGSPSMPQGRGSGSPSSPQGRGNGSPSLPLPDEGEGRAFAICALCKVGCACTSARVG
jgi:hypothetical protein